MIKCIIIEDEPLALKQIKGYIQQLDFLSLEHSFSNAIEPIQFLKNKEIDVIFLDIEMEGLTGIEFLKSVRPDTQVILTTAYDQYALDAFDLDVTDYLLKPISFERFLKAVNKVRFPHNFKEPKRKETPEALFVRTNYKLQRVDFKDILYIEGKREYLRIYTGKESLMTLMSFRKLMDSLPDGFIRVHNSYVVAISKIDSIENGEIIIGRKHIRISKNYSKKVKEELKERGMML